MATKKYISRNGVSLPVEKANEIAILRMRGYSVRFIADKMELTEAQVNAILNVNRE